MKKNQKPVPFQTVIKALLDDEKPFPTRYLYQLSDLSPEDLALLTRTWDSVSLARRQALMEDIRDFNEDDFLMNYYDIGVLALGDPDPQVRILGVLTLSEYEDEDLVELLIRLAEKDPQVDVRAVATAALGRLVYLGEVEELTATALEQIENCLIQIHQGQDAKQVRLIALESLGFSSRDEVDQLIQLAFQSNETDWLASSLIAMGRSYNQAWNPSVVSMLGDKRNIVREEAVRAAGELEITEASDLIKGLLQDNEESIRQAAIWSLSQIGGENVRDLLEQLLEVVEDEDEIELIEGALENLDMTEGFSGLAIFDLDDFDDEDEEEADDDE